MADIVDSYTGNLHPILTFIPIFQTLL